VSKNDPVPQLNIANLIGVVRAELERAELDRRQRGALPLLQLNEFTLELKFVVSKSTSGSGGLDLHVLTLGGEKAVENEQVQKISLKFSLAEFALATAQPGTRFSADSERRPEAVDVPPIE
jgi:hypothetical protein